MRPRECSRCGRPLSIDSAAVVLTDKRRVIRTEAACPACGPQIVNDPVLSIRQIHEGFCQDDSAHLLGGVLTLLGAAVAAALEHDVQTARRRAARRRKRRKQGAAQRGAKTTRKKKPTTRGSLDGDAGTTKK